MSNFSTIFFAVKLIVFISTTFAYNPIQLYGDIPVGEQCQSDNDCKGFPGTAFCNEVGLCWCLDGMLLVPIEGEIICLKKATQVGDECVDDAQCQQGDPGSLSGCFISQLDPSKSVCNCTDDAIHQPPNHRCYPKAVHLGDGCTVKRQCTVNLGEFSECTSQHICACNLASIPNSDNTTCLPIRDSVGDECVLAEQCQLGEPGPLSDCVELEGEDGSPLPEKICNCTADAIHDSDSGTDECHERRCFLDEPCLINAQCSVNMGDLSECSMSTSVCSCKSAGVENFEGNFCLKKALVIGDECSESQQCTEGAPGKFSDCVASDDPEELHTCQCIDQGVKQPDEEICLKMAEHVGDSCSHLIQCTSSLGALSECLDTGICNCTEGLAIPNADGVACLEIINDLGGSCVEASQCQHGTPGKLSICQDGRCSCSPDATFEPGENLCRPRQGFIGGTCEVNAECRANLGELSECVEKQCSCIPTYGVPSESRMACLPVINFIGNDCQEPQQCQMGTPGEHSDCVLSNAVPGNPKKVCNCTSNAILQPGEHKCLLKADEVGADCEYNAQCSITLGEFSECRDTICQCIPERSIPNYDETLCLPIVNLIGDPCEQMEQCHLGTPGPLSNCSRSNVWPYNNVCNCTGDSLNKPGRNVCLKKADHVGDFCEFNGQCTENLGDMAECVEEQETGHLVCGCANGFVGSSDGTRCITGGILIGKPCFDSEQCVGKPRENCECSQSKLCVCFDTHVASAELHDCLPIGQVIGAKCTERQQCQKGEPGELSDCIGPPGEKVCNCTSNSVTVAGGNHCFLKAVLVGDSCQHNIQCEVNLEYSHCLGGSCRCLANTTASTDGRKCIYKSWLDKPCFDNAQCADVEHALCSGEEEKCTCENGFIADPETRSSCVQLASVIGEPCEFEEQCDMLDASYCNKMEGRCECNRGSHVASGDKKRCLGLVERLHNSCEESQQCQVENSQCLPDRNDEIKATCQCPRDVFVETPDGKCLQAAAQIGDECEKDEQCAEIGGTPTCIEGQCKCNNYTQVASQDLKKCLDRLHFLNQVCEESQQCVPDNSVCLPVDLEKRCVCQPSSFVQFENRCLAACANIGDSCEQTAQCMPIGNSSTVECIGNTCKCPGNSQFVDTRCIFPSYLGAPCSFHDECHLGVNNLTACIGSSETSKKCACVTNAIDKDGSCWIFKYVGDSCARDLDCQFILGSAYCGGGVCACPSGLSPDTGGLRCSSASHAVIVTTILLIGLSLNWFTWYKLS